MQSIVNLDAVFVILNRVQAKRRVRQEFTQTYDEFYGNIVANSFVYALKISEKLMIVEI